MSVEVADSGELDVGASEEEASDVGSGTEEELSDGSGLRVVDRADDGMLDVLANLGVVAGKADEEEEEGSTKDVGSKSEDDPIL